MRGSEYTPQRKTSNLFRSRYNENVYVFSLVSPTWYGIEFITSYCFTYNFEFSCSLHSRTVPNGSICSCLCIKFFLSDALVHLCRPRFYQKKRLHS